MFDPTSSGSPWRTAPAVRTTIPLAQLLVAKAQAASTAQQLVRADTLVNDVTVTTAIENNMPTWAPTSADGIEWIGFTEHARLRDHPRAGLQVGVRPQAELWIAAIDMSKLGQGDPSFPAFRVPFIDLTENSHRPFWAEDAFVPPPDLDGGVPGRGLHRPGRRLHQGRVLHGPVPPVRQHLHLRLLRPVATPADAPAQARVVS